MTLTFEDFKPGHFGTFGPRHITRDEIVAYAREYDPQPMHLDEDAANASMLKGLAGSGWHMCSLMMRMIYDGFLHKSASMGSPGVDQMRWLAPFRPGDDLTLDVEVVEARASQSRPTLGIVKFKFSMLNAKGQTISEMITPIMIGRREAAAGN
ncbi:Acyl dehydratase [Bradyrhizobium sp. NFR13]|jgi:acyl dehydratase|uniref:MaoC family dehydratase n=1 Tax=Bradyrhizobium sp. NFR13 TaxID=1566285 RepID=UPI0008E9EF81|nr:MaoC family dehydratase [Bradyrhizobium sp. NFR13]SFL26446.1 Acyl dehydratase [Bradyrhizobium sp. NFR13]